MSISHHFPAAPESRKGASGYLRATQIVALADKLKEQMAGVDGSSQDKSPLDEVVICRDMVVPGPELQLANHQTSGPERHETKTLAQLLDSSRGESGRAHWMDGSYCAKTGELDCRVGVSGSQWDRTTFSLEVKPEGEATRYNFSPAPSWGGPDITTSVLVSRQTGAMTVLESKERDFESWGIITDKALETREYGNLGPTTPELDYFYDSDRQNLEQGKALLDQLKSMDNGRNDLNPRAGVVVVADYNGSGVDAGLRYNVENGQITAASAGSKKGELLAFTLKDDGTESYRVTDRDMMGSREAKSIDFRPDTGEMMVRELETLTFRERQLQLATAAYDKAVAEHRALPFLERMFKADSPNLREYGLTAAKHGLVLYETYRGLTKIYQDPEYPEG